MVPPLSRCHAESTFEHFAEMGKIAKAARVCQFSNGSIGRRPIPEYLPATLKTALQYPISERNARAGEAEMNRPQGYAEMRRDRGRRQVLRGEIGAAIGEHRLSLARACVLCIVLGRHGKQIADIVR